MLGDFAVGKTSLVIQYVAHMFSQKYHTTLGVRVDKKKCAWLTGTFNLSYGIFTARTALPRSVIHICGGCPDI